MGKLETVRVKQKGQVTIPARIRKRHQIKVGDLLEVKESRDSEIVLRPKRLPEPGRPVGEEEQARILKDLEKLRKTWR